MATIYDVAKRANVSTATVSFAFNRPEKVKPDTRERILQAARELDYKPNVNARRLAGGKSQMVALLVNDIRYPSASTTSQTVVEALRIEGFITVLSVTDGDSTTTLQLLEQLHQRGADGFILLPTFATLDKEVVEALRKMMQDKIPVTIISNGLDDPQLDIVSFRAQSAARELVDHLVDLGHRNIAYIGPNHSLGDSTVRYLGYQESLLSNGLAIRPELVIETDFTQPDVKLDMARLMEHPDPPTAIFGSNDLIMMAVIDYCRERQIQIPEQLSLVSFDTVALVQRQTPVITSMMIPTVEVGQKAVDLLLNRIQNPATPPSHEHLRCILDVRASTGAPPSAHI
ncbi:MAG: LacI family DNA-binding transcriptional regulator [Chloroflexota bacterium]